MKRFPLSTLRGHISAPRSNFDMVDTDSESSHQALFIQTKFASDLPECILNYVVSRYAMSLKSLIVLVVVSIYRADARAGARTASETAHAPRASCPSSDDDSIRKRKAPVALLRSAQPVPAGATSLQNSEGRVLN